VQGEPIFGFVLQQGGVRIHRSTCPNANNLLVNYAHRILRADWGMTVRSDFVAEILVTGVDSGPGVIQQLTDRIAALGINIRSFSISGDAGYFEGRVGLVVANIDQLHRAILALKSFNGVSSVSRIE
jgi:GTP pyrophosphokinase